MESGENTGKVQSICFIDPCMATGPLMILMQISVYFYQASYQFYDECIFSAVCVFWRTKHLQYCAVSLKTQDFKKQKNKDEEKPECSFFLSEQMISFKKASPAGLTFSESCCSSLTAACAIGFCCG